MALYLFLLIGITLQAVVTATKDTCTLENIRLPESGKQHIIGLDADDTKFSLQATHDNLQTLVLLLSHFSLASSLTINWGKSTAITAYFFSHARLPD